MDKLVKINWIIFRREEKYVIKLVHQCEYGLCCCVTTCKEPVTASCTTCLPFSLTAWDALYLLSTRTILKLDSYLFELGKENVILN